MHQHLQHQLHRLFGQTVTIETSLGKPIRLFVNGVTIARAWTAEAAVRQATRALSAGIALQTGGQTR